VRFLHTRDADLGVGAPAGEPEAERARGAGGAWRQPVPLHGLRKDPERGHAGGPGALSQLSWVDPLVLLWVALAALVGYQRGFVAQLLSLAGVALGALAGSRLAPFFLPGGESSPWVPLASLVGAVVGAVLLQVAGSVIGSKIRGAVVHTPFRLPDSAGGVVIGATVGLAAAWLAAVAALQVQESLLRRTVQESAILSSLVEAVPPRTVLRALARFDPLPLIAAPPDLRLPPPDGSVLASPVAKAAGRSVVKVQTIACGVGIQGSGWVIEGELVATNAHVVAGQDRTEVAAPNGQVVSAFPVYLDTDNDVAFLLADDLAVPPLEVARNPPSDDEVVLLGYPRDGPLTATAATAGAPTKVLAPDTRGARAGLRTVVPLRGDVERGESGGPVVNEAGRVVAMMFAAAQGGDGGFGVPVKEIVRGLESELEPVSAGECIG
jgi:S1-C subfamily serine protease